METGARIGALARLRYPGGFPLPSTFGDADRAIEDTQASLAQGLDCLFEPTFAADGYLARIDVLHRNHLGWVIDEVKSSTVKEPKDLAKKNYDRELAFQRLVLERCGLPVQSTRLILIDSKVAWTGGPYDPNSMLAEVDMTAMAQAIAPDVETLAASLRDALDSPDQPEVELNTHCKECDYFEHCHAERPRHDLIFLAKIQPRQVQNLRARGYQSVEDIPDGVLKGRQEIQRQVVQSGRPYLDPGLKSALEAIEFPAAFIDYETSNPAFPAIPGTRPYEQLCFQWSAHVLDAPGAEPRHHEFLPADASDPRAEFCRSLWEVAKDCRSIVTYTEFEVRQLRPMAEAGLPCASSLLESVQTRLVDLHKIVADHVYFADFMAKTSIKVVLPTLVPSMSYHDLLIADGQAAAAGYREMINPDTSPTRRAELRDALLRYCAQDTLAMVEIYRALLHLAG